MHTSSIFTRSRMGLDNNIWLSMLIVILLSAGILGYNINHKGEEKECKTVNIVVNGRINTDSVTFYTDQPMTFRSSISPGDNVIWDFGDGSKNEEVAYTIHTFRREEQYSVRILVNGKCWYTRKIHLEKLANDITDTTGNIVEYIIAKGEANVREIIKFSTPLSASSYEWYVENNRHYPLKNGSQVNYGFKSEGKYTIVLQLDHDNQKRYKKDIYILGIADQKNDLVIPERLIIIPPVVHEKTDSVIPPKDSAVVKPLEPPKRFRYVKDEIFIKYLQALVCNGMKPEDFDSYLCDGANTSVIINKLDRKTFAQLAVEIQGKRIKIESVKANRDNGNCINFLAVSYNKKGFLGKNPCRN